MENITEDEMKILVELWCNGEHPAVRYWNMPRLAHTIRDLKRKGLVEFCPNRMALKITDKGIKEISPAEPCV